MILWLVKSVFFHLIQSILQIHAWVFHCKLINLLLVWLPRLRANSSFLRLRYSWWFVDGSGLHGCYPLGLHGCNGWRGCNPFPETQWLQRFQTDGVNIDQSIQARPRTSLLHNTHWYQCIHVAYCLTSGHWWPSGYGLVGRPTLTWVQVCHLTQHGSSDLQVSLQRGLQSMMNVQETHRFTPNGSDFNWPRVIIWSSYCRRIGGRSPHRSTDCRDIPRASAIFDIEPKCFLHCLEVISHPLIKYICPSVNLSCVQNNPRFYRTGMVWNPLKT